MNEIKMGDAILAENIKGICFDLYGTLLILHNLREAWSDWFLKFYECLKKFGLELSQEALKVKLEVFFSKLEPPIKDDGLTLYERRIQRQCTNLGLELDKTEYQEIANISVRTWHSYTILDPEVVPLLEKLSKKYKLALVSNFDHPPHIRSVLLELNLEKYFPWIIISGEVEYKKPDPKIFSLVLDQMDLSPPEVIHIGDSQDDIEGANAAGIYSVHIKRNDMELISDYKKSVVGLKTSEKSPIINSQRTITRLSELLDILS
jgi:putative hydrolase of the HAD superfamily